MGQKLSEKAAKKKRGYIREQNKVMYSQLNFRVPKELLGAVKMAAKEEGVSQRQYIINTLEEKLQKNS